MRVVLLVTAFPTLSETFIVNKFVGLADRTWDVHIVCVQPGQSEWSSFPELQRRPHLRQRVHSAWLHRPRWLAMIMIPIALLRCISINPLGCLRYLLKGWPRFGFDVFRRLYFDAELVVLKPDLLHLEFGTLGVDRMYLGDLLNCEVVVSFRGYDLNHVGLEDSNSYEEVWKKASALHFLGQDLWQRAQRLGCGPAQNHVLIPPAIDTELFDPANRRHHEVAGTTQRPLRILSVGRLDWKKGYDYALQAVKDLVERGIQCEYRIVGDGGYLEAVAFARYQFGIERVVELLGRRSGNDLLAELGWADVFLHPSVSEGFCNAVLEAQSMMLPVVCSDAGGLSENVSDTVTGFVVPRRQQQALAEKMAMLAKDPELRQRMGLAGRERVQTNFSLADQLDSFETWYRDLLASDRPKAEPRKKSASLDAPAAVTRVLERK